MISIKLSFNGFFILGKYLELNNFKNWINENMMLKFQDFLAFKIFNFILDSYKELEF